MDARSAGQNEELCDRLGFDYRAKYAEKALDCWTIFVTRSTVSIVHDVQVESMFLAIASPFLK